MDVVNKEQAVIAEQAGACAVMALERIPADIRHHGEVARMSPVETVLEIKEAVSIPVMAKCRVGHTMEALILQELGVDFIDESEVLTPADDELHIAKSGFEIPFVCGARDAGEALRRFAEGAAMVRTKGEAGTGNIIEAVRHIRQIRQGIAQVLHADEQEVQRLAKSYGVGIEVILAVQKAGRLPLVNFAAGGVATPADAALMMHLGCDGVFVGSGIFKSSKPEALARAMVEAVTHFEDPKRLMQISQGIGQPMRGIEMAQLTSDQMFADRST